MAPVGGSAGQAGGVFGAYAGKAGGDDAGALAMDAKIQNQLSDVRKSRGVGATD